MAACGSVQCDHYHSRSALPKSTPGDCLGSAASPQVSIITDVLEKLPSVAAEMVMGPALAGVDSY